MVVLEYFCTALCTGDNARESLLESPWLSMLESLMYVNSILYMRKKNIQGKTRGYFVGHGNLEEELGKEHGRGIFRNILPADSFSQGLAAD